MPSQSITRPALTALFFLLLLSCQKSAAPEETVLPSSDWNDHPSLTDSLSFLVLGDWGRSGNALQRSVAQAMDAASQRHNARLIVTSGDNFYENGVASTSDPAWQSSFGLVYNSPGHQLPWYAVLGNHDYSGNPQAQVAYTTAGTRWHMPARYYDLRQDIDNTHKVLFLFTDTSPVVGAYHATGMSDLDLQDTAAQRTWLEQQLGSSPFSWKIVIGHHPIYSSGLHGPTPELVSRFVPLFSANKVDFYIAGHDHTLQYQRPASGTTHYLISGSGSEFTPVSSNGDTRFAASTSGFVTITLYASAAHLYFYNSNGTLLYRSEIRK
ncbi:MAG: acid phosphatase [Chitinophagaceae bacterium]|nr:MAG: acid phosphatase [Chitinophagaceae bacterium]